jgi:hypothetical protein
MADLEGNYSKVPSDVQDSQHSSHGWSKTGGLLLAGSGLMLFIVATSASFSSVSSTTSTESTNLFGFTNLKQAAMNKPPPAALPFRRNVNYMNHQSNNMYQQRSQPFNLPYQPRSGFLPRAQFFDRFFKGQDPNLYEGTDWQPGDRAEFFSRSKGGWIACTITDVSDGGVEVDVKPGYLIRGREVATGLRKPFGVKGQPRPDRPL